MGTDIILTSQSDVNGQKKWHAWQDTQDRKKDPCMRNQGRTACCLSGGDNYATAQEANAEPTAIHTGQNRQWRKTESQSQV